MSQKKRVLFALVIAAVIVIAVFSSFAINLLFRGNDTIELPSITNTGSAGEDTPSASGDLDGVRIAGAVDDDAAFHRVKTVFPAESGGPDILAASQGRQHRVIQDRCSAFQKRLVRQRGEDQRIHPDLVEPVLCG